MRLRYSAEALAHLEAINDFLTERNPAAARRIAAEIGMPPGGFATFHILGAQVI